MVKRRIKKEDRPDTTYLIQRGIRINTPPIQVEIQSNDQRDSLIKIKVMAEAIIEKYSKCKREGDHQ
jgi:hypothetical protein